MNMNNFNFTVLEGNLTRDPELRKLPSGTSVATFSVACNSSYNKKDGTKVDEVSFYEVNAWARLGEIVCQYLKKGSRVLVSGRLKQNRWEKDGVKHSRIVLEAREVNFLSKPQEQGGGAHQAEDDFRDLPVDQPAPGIQFAEGEEVPF
jgi:single-strand DNA-binding protein